MTENTNSIRVPQFFVIAITVVLSGCEISKTPNLSIKKSSAHAYAQYYDEKGNMIRLGHNVPDLLQNDQTTLPVISYVDVSQRYDLVYYHCNKGFVTDHLCVQNAQSRAFWETFGLSVKTEVRLIPVLILTSKRSENLLPSQTKGLPTDFDSNLRFCSDWTYILCPNLWLDDLKRLFSPTEPHIYTFKNYSAPDFTFWLEHHYTNKPVIDETNLSGVYDFKFIKNNNLNTLNLTEIGFELHEDQRPVEAIYIETIPNTTTDASTKDLHGCYQFYPAWEKAN